MPRYHFHVVDGVSLRDYRGTELSDETEARRYAEDMAKTVARSLKGQRQRIKVTDDNGREVLALSINPER